MLIRWEAEFRVELTVTWPKPELCSRFTNLPGYSTKDQKKSTINPDSYVSGVHSADPLFGFGSNIIHHFIGHCKRDSQPLKGDYYLSDLCFSHKNKPILSIKLNCLCRIYSSQANSKINRNPKSIYFHSVTEIEVRNLITSLPNKTSSGYDNINNILLKKLCNSIALPLTHIFNLSISKGVFPTKMKMAETCPLYKGKETYYTNNYRSISLLLTVSKILEKIVYKRTYKFLNLTNQFYNSQYGFRTSHSCEDAVCELVGEVIKIRKTVNLQWLYI